MQTVKCPKCGKAIQVQAGRMHGDIILCPHYTGGKACNALLLVVRIGAHRVVLEFIGYT